MGIKLVVGLGNPGLDYQGTRHNIGFLVVERIAQRAGIEFKLNKHLYSDLTKLVFNGRSILLAKPNTFMNRSGQAVSSLLNYFKFKPEELLVVHDDLDLDPGRLRFKYGGRSGGHNGIKDIECCLGTSHYYRLRIGIGHPRNFLGKDTYSHQKVAQYVLKVPSQVDQDKLEEAIDRIFQVLNPLLEADLHATQQVLHS
ncbi:MAG: aminoacyl-tRNA hydrolase [Neisseriaceae bacterium]